MEPQQPKIPQEPKMFQAMAQQVQTLAASTDQIIGFIKMQQEVVSERHAARLSRALEELEKSKEALSTIMLEVFSDQQ